MTRKRTCICRLLPRRYQRFQYKSRAFLAHVWTARDGKCGQRCCSDFQRIITGDMFELSVQSALEEVVNANADDVLLCHGESLSNE